MCMTMSEPRREELAPVFAEFGHACHQAQLLEEALRLLLLIGREYAKAQIPDEAIRYPVNPEGIKTLGPLFEAVRTVEVVEGRDVDLIRKAISLRNRLIHGPWPSELRWFTPEGRREVIEEFKSTWSFLRVATGIVHKMIDKYLSASGLSMQYFMDRANAIYVSDTDIPDDEELIH